MNLRTRLKRGAIGAFAALLVFSAGAFAQTSSIDLTVGMVNGTRALTVTGVDGTGTPSPSTAAALAFNENSTTGKLGLIVTDVLYDDVPYSVTAMLSNLYKLDPTDASGFSCTAAEVPSGAFTADFATQGGSVADPVAVVEPVLTFSGTLTSAIDPLLDGETITATLDGLYQEVSTLEPLMSVDNGSGGQFLRQMAHPQCGDATSHTDGPSNIVLQVGTPKDDPIDLNSIASDLWGSLTGASDGLTVSEAIDAGILEGSADDAPSAGDGPGRLYEIVEQELLDLSILGLTVDTQLVLDVIGELTMDTAPTLTLDDLVAQSGVYTNVPELTFDPAQADNATTGLYQGTMTVTLSTQ